MEEDVVILRVDTGEAVKSVGDLRYNISEYKKILNETKIGTAEYQEALKGLTESQNALRGAMNANTASLEQVSQAAMGLGDSYNALVNRLADLKREWRSTTDEAKRANLGAQILEVNNRLKEMDASVGNFQRNVGDYANGVAKGLDAFTKGVGNAIPGLNSFKLAADGISKSPFIAIIGLLVNLFVKLVQRMKETKEGQERINRITTAFGKILEPINALVGWISDALGALFDWLAPAISKVATWLGKVSTKIAGVGNVILQYLLAPIRSVIAVVKGAAKIIGDIFKGNWGKIKEDAKEVGKGVGDAWKKGFDVSANYEAGKKAGEDVLAGFGSRSNKKKAKEKGKEMGSIIGEAIIDGTRDALDALEESEYWDKYTRDEADKAMDAALERQKKREEAARREQELTAKIWEEEQKEREEKEKQRAENMKKTWETSVSAVAGIIGSLADIYEASGEQSEASEKRIKALRIASATISMIQGAIGAYTQAAATIAPPFGMIIGAANAATVTAAGLANIAKMRSTSLSGGSTSTTAPSGFKSSSVSAAAPVQAAATPTALATLANDTAILNSMGNQRVYILASDIEASNNARRVQVAETTF